MAQADAPLPDRPQARRLVASVAVFWTAWAVGVAGLIAGAPMFGFALLPGVAAGVFFYYTLYDVWRDRSGRSPLAMLFFGGFFLPTSMRVMLALVRPSWIASVLRATGWPLRRLATALAGLLLLDIGLFIALLVHPPR